MVVVQEQQSAWLRNFNPFLTSGARWPSAAGVHEPLLVYNPMTGAYTPWLAESFRWDRPAEQLTFSLDEHLGALQLQADEAFGGDHAVAEGLTLSASFDSVSLTEVQILEDYLALTARVRGSLSATASQ